MSIHEEDTELWDAVRKNNANAFTQLFDRYWSAVFTTAFSYLKDREACMEVTHDIFLNIWQKRDKLQIVSFQKYLTMSARYHVFKHIKALKAAPISYVEQMEECGYPSAAINEGEENIRYMELQNRMDNCLKKLPARCREIFILSRKESLSNDEIARRLGISKRTVENQITTALQHLRISFKELLFILILIGYF